MTSLSRWLDRAQISPRSQRVLSEALLDWQYEVTTAQTFGTALWRHCRAAFGMCRALVLVVAGETSSALSLSWSARLVFWVIVLTTLNMWDKSALLDLPHGWVSYRMLLIQTINGNLLFAPVLAIVTGPRAAKSPLIGYAVAGLAISAVLSWVAIPAAWRAYADVAIGRPLPWSNGPQYPVGRLLWLSLLTGILYAIADRVRCWPRRFITTTTAFAAIWSFWGFRVLLDRIVHFFMHPRTFDEWRELTRTLNAATMWLLPLWLLATWILLVRYQERITRTADRPTG